MSAFDKDIIIGYAAQITSLRAVNGGHTLQLRDGKYVVKWGDSDSKG